LLKLRVAGCIFFPSCGVFDFRQAAESAGPCQCLSHEMGAIASCICGGSEAPAPIKPVAAQCTVAGYDFVEPAKEEPPAPIPAPAAPAPAPVVSYPNEEPPPKVMTPAPTTPIVLETLQGAWVNSMGAKISVNGTAVSLNGLVMKMHPITLNEDGTVKSVGKLWQLKGWLEDERVEFKEAPSPEVMEFARSVIWTKATTEKMAEWTEQMKGLGYSGSSSNPLGRGIEGCMPGTSDAHAKLVADDVDRDKAELKLLNDLIVKWRFSDFQQVPPRKVIPDFSNRGHTGLSVEHVHYLATSFREKGFQKRRGDQGHDIPVLVNESTSSELGQKSIANWRSKLAEENGFPPKEHYERAFAGQELYTSLGNGHFNQALNLFGNECSSIYDSKSYSIGNDRDLKEAVQTGVSSIVLKGEIPLRDREIISRLLNSKREYKWKVHPDGSVDISDSSEDHSTVKQFEAMSKVLDAVELNCLVRSELGIKASHRIGQ